MQYRVFLPGGGPLLVELPPLRPGEPVTAVVDGRMLPVTLLEEAGGGLTLSIGGARYPLLDLPPAAPGAVGMEGSGAEVRFLHRGWPFSARVETENDRLRAAAGGALSRLGPFEVRSPLPGLVRQVLVSPGATVEADTPLFTLEAMKMENEVRAGRSGRVAEVLVTAGQIVNTGDVLARVDPG